jgi:hypothetical protein
MQEDGITRPEVRREIENFISLSGGHPFTSKQIDDQYNYATRRTKQYRSQILGELARDGIIKQLGANRFKALDGKLEELEWQAASVEDTVNLAWPLGLERYVKVYHQSIIIVAGSPGAGKTGFLYDLTLKNMGHPMGLVVLSNDMTSEEILERMIGAEMEIPTPAPFKMWECFADFQDHPKFLPDGINVIDYLDLNSEVYMIGEEIEKIYRKLDRGIAIVAIQKRPGQQIGMGGVFSWKRAKLYLSLDTAKEMGDLFHKLEIVKARGRAKPEVNPRGMEFKYYLINGIKHIAKEYG